MSYSVHHDDGANNVNADTFNDNDINSIDDDRFAIERDRDA